MSQNVLLASDSNELRGRIHDAAGGTSVAVSSHPLPVEPMQLLALTQHQTLPDVLVLDATSDAPSALGLAARFDRDFPGTGVLLIGDPVALSSAAMRAGVRGVVPEDAGQEQLRDVIAQIARAMQSRRLGIGAGAVGQPLDAPGRVLTVLSPKGGAGKTMLATNLAIGLAERAPGSVVLVDLDVQFGDVATALNLDPEYTLDDVVHGAALTDAIAMKTLLTLHESGLSVVCAPESPVAADGITAEQVNALLETLKTQFRYVVVDTAAGLEPRTLAALDHTTEPILVTTFDVAGARGLRKEIATLRELGMLTNARQTILNFADPKAGLSVSDIEATIRSGVDLTIPYSKAVTASLNTGIPLLQRAPRDPVVKQVRKLLGAFAPAAKPLQPFGKSES
ncbi:pilus assembly protein CpaE [Agrococcus baldri]|uniref:Pilus assembly protein CpaE n=1 Tax=Agrococcus baldri TaxID=153730 RepID=A0AA94KYG3_9MICO|nr:AAA family ATPase [Agrococcus baldri]SFR98426.1 pilus assembly protein CpaE [Agrococcus baldri]